ncbi:MAG: ATP-binding protein [Lachnospiraceae bacterium]|nr:ATP-binding protein [Lachnospiraceae bacterium]
MTSSPLKQNTDTRKNKRCQYFDRICVILYDNYDLKFPRNSNISSDDLCIILFNLLDNAMDACRICQEKAPQAAPSISVTIRLIHQFLIIKVSNPCAHKPRRLSGLFSTTKQNTLHHGIGLRNVRETAEKYGGNVEFEVRENTFVTSVLLFFQT